MSSIITSAQVIERTGADATTGDLVAKAINQLIETATGRVWGESQTVTEVYDAANVLWLSQMDITGVSDVKVGFPNKLPRTTLEASSYSFNKYGRLVLSYAPMKALPPSTSDYIEVTVTHGVPADKIPADLILAALSLASSYYSYAIENGGNEVSEEAIGSYRIRYLDGSGSSDGTVNKKSRDWQVINAYAKRLV